MMDEFQRGLITGLAMQPLQVTTEHSTPDTIKEEAVPFIRAFISGVNIIGIFQASNGDIAE